MKTFLHEKYDRRMEVYRIAIQLFGWKVGVGFWFGPRRHFRFRKYPCWFSDRLTGFELDLSRLSLATKRADE